MLPVHKAQTPRSADILEMPAIHGQSDDRHRRPVAPFAYGRGPAQAIAPLGPKYAIASCICSNQRGFTGAPSYR